MMNESVHYFLDIHPSFRSSLRAQCSGRAALCSWNTFPPDDTCCFCFVFNKWNGLMTLVNLSGAELTVEKEPSLCPALCVCLCLFPPPFLHWNFVSFVKENKNKNKNRPNFESESNFYCHDNVHCPQSVRICKAVNFVIRSNKSMERMEPCMVLDWGTINFLSF